MAASITQGVGPTILTGPPATRTVGATAAVSSVASTTVGASDGSFLVSMNLNITTSNSFSFATECAYTDETGTSRTLRFTLFDTSGNVITNGTVTNSGGAIAYASPAMEIRAKAATTITLRTNSGGTYTTVTFNVEGLIQQVG